MPPALEAHMIPFNEWKPCLLFMCLLFMCFEIKIVFRRQKNDASHSAPSTTRDEPAAADQTHLPACTCPTVVARLHGSH